MIKNFLVVGAIFVLCGACTKPDTTTRILTDAGYTNIHITGYKVFGCGSNDNDDEDFHTGFTATSANGSQVRGVVCSGVFKGSTIRLF